MALNLARPSAITLAKTEQSLEHALAAFRAVLTEEQRKDLDTVKHVPDAHAVLVFTAELDAKRRTAKGRSIASRLYSILQCVRDFSSVVDTFVSSNPQIAALVWGSVKMTMMVAVNFLSYFEVLTELFLNLGKVSPQFDQYQVLFPESRRVQTALCEFHAAVIRCCQHVIVAIRRPWQNQLFNSLWQSLEKEFSPDMDEIKNQRDLVDRELDLARTQAVLRNQQLQLKEQEEAGSFWVTMRRITGQTSSTVKELSERIDKQRARERRKELLDALSTHDHVSPHRQNCKKRHSDTVNWFFETPEFERWMSGGSQTLWCSGKMGSGKTILASSVINHVLTEKQASRKLVTFFFPRFDDQDSLRSETILRSIARQAIESASIVDDTLPLLETLMSRDGVAAATLTKLITKTAGTVDKLYIIIDGLDECEPAERRALLKTLASLVGLDQGVRLFVASRETVSDEIRRNFTSHEHVSMGCLSGQSDISAYVTSTIDTLLNDEDLCVSDPSLVDEVKEALIKHADGMFLWAAFQLRAICSKANDEEIRNAISSENLPKDLTDIFNRALNRIVSSGKEEFVLKLLPWITAAARPMTLDELQESAMIEIRQTFSMPERRVNGIHRLNPWFQGLVDVDEETKAASFSHASIRHFFIGGIGGELKRFGVDLDEADHYIGEILSTYLFFSDFQTTLARWTRPGPAVKPMDLARRAVGDHWKLPYDSLKQHGRSRAKSASARAFSSRMGINETLTSFTRDDHDAAFAKFQVSHPFLIYASSNLFFHTKTFSVSKSKTWSLFDQILTNGHALVRPPWAANSDQALEYLTMLEWACSVAHAPLIGLISSHNAPARDKKKMLRPKVFKLLGIDDIEPSKDLTTGTSELVWNISHHGQENAFGVLLGFVDPQEKNLVQREALFVSVISGQAKFVQKLLPQVMADVCKRENRAFNIAALIGDIGITEQFLDACVACKGTRQCLEPALFAAAQGGSVEIAQMFIDKVNSLSIYSWQRAQMAASSYGHGQIVEMLSKAGVTRTPSPRR